jgi:hypothetical protein
MKPIHKFNNGRGATLCHTCRTIISTGFIDALQCQKCKLKLMESLEKKPKQETTLEEALLEDIKFLLLAKSDASAIRLIEKYGHNKQQERSYSQLDVVRILSKYETLSNEDFNQWFEQFKKK